MPDDPVGGALFWEVEELGFGGGALVDASWDVFGSDAGALGFTESVIPLLVITVAELMRRVSVPYTMSEVPCRTIVSLPTRIVSDEVGLAVYVLPSMTTISVADEPALLAE
jgi:hypothetical protein